MPIGIYDRSKGNKGWFKKGNKPLCPFKKGHKINEGKKHWNWKDGLSKTNPALAQRKWRHEKGISKKYSSKYGGITGEYKHKSSTEYMRVWRKKYPQKAKQLRWFYKYNKKKAGLLTLKIIQRVYEENIKTFRTLTCIYCFKSIQFGNDSLEHIIPLTKGGTNKYENLAIACRKCNTSKGNKFLEEWFKNKKEGF